MNKKTTPIDLDELLQQAGWIKNLAFATVRDFSLAEDVTQEVLLKALSEPRRTEPVLRAWLAAVTRNIARNEVRGLIRRRQRETKVAYTEVKSDGCDSSHQDELLQTHRELTYAIEALSPKHREVVVLRFFEEKSFHAIATQLEIQEGAARVRLHRALEEMRSLLQKSSGDWRATCLLLAPTAGLVSPSLVSTFTLKKLVLIAAVVLMGTVLWLENTETDPNTTAPLVVVAQDEVAPVINHETAAGPEIVIERSEIPNGDEIVESNLSSKQEGGGLSGWVFLGDDPASGVQVHHGGEVGESNFEGFFELSTYNPYELVRFEKNGVPDLLALAAKKQDSHKMAHSSSLSITVTDNHSRAAGMPVSLFLARDSASERYVVADEKKEIWRGNLESNGHVEVLNVPTTLPGSQAPIDPIFVKLVFQGGASIFLLPKIKWTRSSQGEWDCKISIYFRDPGSALSSSLLLQSESTGLPVSRKVAYKTEGYFTSPWHEGRTDMDGLLPLNGRISTHANGIVWLRPNLTYWFDGSGLLETNGRQVCLLPEANSLSISVDGDIPNGVRIEATSVVSRENRTKTASNLAEGPGAPQFHSWSPVTLDEEMLIDGGWIGNNRGVAVRALPGEALISLVEVEGDKLEKISLPPLAIVRAKVSMPNINLSSGARFYLRRGDERLGGYFVSVNSDEPWTFVVPADTYYAWLRLPGEKGIPLGKFELIKGKNTIVFSGTEDKLYSLQFKFAGKSLVDGSVRLNGRHEVLDRTGSCTIWALPESSFTYSFAMRGLGAVGKKKLEESSSIDLFMDYKGEAVFSKDGAPMSLEIETGLLHLLGHPQENRKAFIRSIDDSNLRSPGIELPIPAGASYQIVLPTGRYVLEFPASSEEQEFVISHTLESLIDVP